MKDGCVWLWSWIREWWWAFPVVAVWMIVLGAAKVQAVMLGGTMRCCDWLAACIDEDEDGEEQGD